MVENPLKMSTLISRLTSPFLIKKCVEGLHLVNVYFKLKERYRSLPRYVNIGCTKGMGEGKGERG